MKTLEKAEFIGKGFCSDVYAWSNDRVLKLYRDSHAEAEREFTVTRAVRAAGVPAPDAYEVIEVDGRPGIVFERIEGMSLLECTRARPWRLFNASRLLAEVHAQIHQCRGPAVMPSLRQRIATAIDAANDITEVSRQMVKSQLADLPDGAALCHGDFHPGNVLITPRGPVVIDWDSASCGDPLGDVACTSRLMRTSALPPWSPGYMHLLLRCLRPVMHRSYVKRYLHLHGGKREQIKAWEAPLAVAAKTWRGLATQR